MNGIVKSYTHGGKLIALILALVFGIIFLSGCGSDPIQEDLINYSNVGLVSVAEIESKVVDGYDSVSGDNYTDDITVYNKLIDEVIPNSLKLIDKAEAIEIKTEDVRAVHELYVAAVNTQNSAFTTIVAAIEAQDYDKISAANDKLSEARKGMRDYQAKLKELADEHGVEFIADED